MPKLHYVLLIPPLPLSVSIYWLGAESIALSTAFHNPQVEILWPINFSEPEPRASRLVELPKSGKTSFKGNN